MDSAHALYTHPHISTPAYCSFSQEGRIHCQHIIHLPLLSSPPYLCGMLLKMINCYFSACPLQDVISLTSLFTGPVRPAITSMHAEICRLHWAKVLTSGAVAGDQAVSLDPGRAPVMVSLLQLQSKKKRKKKKAKDGGQGTGRGRWMKCRQIFCMH